MQESRGSVVQQLLFSENVTKPCKLILKEQVKLIGHEPISEARQRQRHAVGKISATLRELDNCCIENILVNI